MKIVHIVNADKIKRDNIKNMRFGNFIKLELPTRHTSIFVKNTPKPENQEIIGLQNIANELKKVANDKINIFKKKLYDRPFMPGCVEADSNYSNVLFIEDANGKFIKGFKKIISFLIDNDVDFTVHSQDLFRVDERFTGKILKYFGSPYPNLAEYANTTKPDMLVKL